MDCAQLSYLHLAQVLEWNRKLNKLRIFSFDYLISGWEVNVLCSCRARHANQRWGFPPSLWCGMCS